MRNKKLKIIIVGAGPAGLSAATVFDKDKDEYRNDNNYKITLIEKTNSVGGLAKTLKRKNSYFYDIGPHRFFTKNEEINNFFIYYAKNDLIKVKRLTRILYNQTYFNYPLTPFSTLKKLGILKSLNIILSYIYSVFFFKKKIRSFEDWIIKNFGNNLYQIFFKTYTEKVWGIPCKNIGSDWGEQRIKKLNLLEIIKSFFFKTQNKSLVDEFFYLKKGAGNLYTNIQKNLKNTKIFFNSKVTKYHFSKDKKKIIYITVIDHLKKKKKIYGDYFICSAPITETIKNFNISIPKKITGIINSLKYRNHIGVNFLIEGNIFKDNWIYIHSKEVKVARISNYKNFSKYMTKKDNLNPVTMEYFCDEKSTLWNLKDNDLIEIAKKELNYLNLSKNARILDSFVIRSEKAYPVIKIGYKHNINKIKKFLGFIENFIPVGRTGMFKYNNQDHAILTGIIGANKILKNNKLDPWNVNIDAEYHETKK